MRIVGGMLVSPFVFYSMTLREAKLAIKGHNREIKNDYYYNLYATTNAVGSCLGGKKFSPIDPFNDNKKSSKMTTAEYAQTLKAMGIDPRDVKESKWDDNWDKMTTEEKRKTLFNK